MSIEFFMVATGTLVGIDSRNWLFVMNDKVFCDNGRSFESQEATVSFDTFITERPDIGWRVTP